jgi:WhiB family redox-sensing transcriptional regulator
VVIAWQNHPERKCKTEDPELFFPAGHGGAAELQAEVAKAVCLGCPVRQECLECALTYREEGVWGGTTEIERKALRKAAA